MHACTHTHTCARYTRIHMHTHKCARTHAHAHIIIYAASNVLLSEHGDVKLANLSVAKKLKDTIYQYTLSPNPPFWLAPEVIMQSSYDIMAEIWSLGITAIELAHGEPPHTDIHPMRATFLIAKHPSPEIKGEHSHAFKKFVACCLNKDPEHVSWPLFLPLCSSLPSSPSPISHSPPLPPPPSSSSSPSSSISSLPPSSGRQRRSF